MLTSRRIIIAARLLFVFAAAGMGVLMLGPFQGLEQVFGLTDKAAHAIAFYALAVGLFLIAPSRRRDDLVIFVIAAALAAEGLQFFTGRSVSVGDFLAGAGGAVAAWLPGFVEQVRHAARRYPDLTLAQASAIDRRRRGRASAIQNPTATARTRRA
jgi:VanZ family protein